MCIDGVLTTDYKTCQRQPSGDLGAPFSEEYNVFAPLYNDIDLTLMNTTRTGDQRLYYCKYQVDSTTGTSSSSQQSFGVPPAVQTRLRSLSGVHSFTPHSAIVLTWKDVSPFPARLYTDRVCL